MLQNDEDDDPNVWIACSIFPYFIVTRLLLLFIVNTRWFSVAKIARKQANLYDKDLTCGVYVCCKQHISK